MSKITYCIPDGDKIYDVIEHYHHQFDKKKVPLAERVGFIIDTFYENERLMKKRGIDSWLHFGGTLPAVERVIAIHKGETEQSFYARTQYPKHIVDAYSIIDEDGEYDDFGTLVFADLYKQQHLRTIPSNSTVWRLNDDEYIDLAQFENRLRGVERERF